MPDNPSPAAGWREMLPALADMPQVTKRLEAGQQFNAYNGSQFGIYWVGIGPVTNFCSITRCGSPEAANLIVAALRIASGQPAALCPLSTSEDEDDEG